MQNLMASTRDLRISGTPAFSGPANLQSQQAGVMQEQARDYRPSPQGTLDRYREEGEQRDQRTPGAYSEHGQPTRGSGLPPRLPPIQDLLQKHEALQAPGKSRERRDHKGACLLCRRRRVAYECNCRTPCSYCATHSKRCAYEWDIKKDAKKCSRCNKMNPDLCTGDETGCERCHNEGIECVYSKTSGKRLASCSNCSEVGAGGHCFRRGDRSCRRCTVEELDNCEFGPRDTNLNRTGAQGPDLQPKQPPLNIAPGDTPGWIARESGGFYYSDWLLHPTKAPRGTHKPRTTVGKNSQGEPVGFDLRYEMWVYPLHRAVRDPLGSGRAIGLNMRTEFAYDRDYPGPGPVTALSTGSETRMIPAGQSSGPRPSEDTPQGYDTSRPSGNPAMGSTGDRSGSSSSRRRPTEEGDTDGRKDAKRGKHAK